MSCTAKQQPRCTVLYCTVLHCTELKYNAPNALYCTVLHCHINIKIWYYVLISFFMKETFAFTKQTIAQTNYDIYEFIILLNNVTYFTHSILAIYIHVQCSAVQCIALHCSVIHYSEFQFSSGKCTALHLRAFHYNTRTYLYQSALGSSLSCSIK